MSRTSTNRTLISVATALIAGLLLMPAFASAANAPMDRGAFKRECERRGGVFTEGKNSEGKTVWMCTKDGKIIADCTINRTGSGACSTPIDWPTKLDDSSPAGSGGVPHRTDPAQQIDEGPNSPSTSGDTGTGPLYTGPAQRLPASP